MCVCLREERVCEREGESVCVCYLQSGLFSHMFKVTSQILFVMVMMMNICVCVCVCKRERERVWGHVCVCVRERVFVLHTEWSFQPYV